MSKGQPAWRISNVSEHNTTAVSSPSSTHDGSHQTAKAVHGEQPKQAAEPSAHAAASASGTKAPLEGKPAEKKRSSKLSDDKRFKIFSGSANRPLTEAIGKFLGVPVGETRLQRFSDGETHFQLLENVRGVDVFLVQPTCHPVDQNLVELLIMMDALRRASAGRITVVVPYYGYARQDRKDRPRVAITSKLVADLLTTARRKPRLVRRSACSADSGLLQYPGRPSICQPGAGGLLSRSEAAEPHRGKSRCGRRGEG